MNLRRCSSPICPVRGISQAEDGGSLIESPRGQPGPQTDGGGSSVNSATVPTPGALPAAPRTLSAVVVDDAPHEAEPDAGALELGSRMHPLERLEQRRPRCSCRSRPRCRSRGTRCHARRCSCRRARRARLRGRCTSTRCRAGSATPGPPSSGSAFAAGSASTRHSVRRSGCAVAISDHVSSATACMSTGSRRSGCRVTWARPDRALIMAVIRRAARSIRVGCNPAPPPHVPTAAGDAAGRRTPASR